MKTKLTIAALCALTMASLCGKCDNLLLAPSGSCLHTGQFRAEAAIGMDNSDDRFYWLGFGIAQFEANLVSERHPVTGTDNIVTLQYHAFPQTAVTPSISLGVWDVADETKDGVAPFIAATKELYIGDEGRLIRNVEATLGAGFNGLDGLFGGVKVGLPHNISLCGEYFQDKINLSLGFNLGSVAAVKLYRMRGDNYYGLSFTPIRF